MERTPVYHSDRDDPFANLMQRGMRVARRLAISFAAAVVAAIGLAALAADNAFVQVLFTAVATLALWLPMFFLFGAIERLFARKPIQRAIAVDAAPASSSNEDQIWRRLTVAAPHHADRIGVLRRSIERSRLALGKAEMDPSAKDVCLLIDRRLPQLIERELDDLVPDDRGRKRQLDELVGLVEDFARDCSRRNPDGSAVDRESAEVLRRRFEAHLSGF